MKVKELISVLQRMDQEAEIVMEDFTLDYRKVGGVVRQVPENYDDGIPSGPLGSIMVYSVDSIRDGFSMLPNAVDR